MAKIKVVCNLSRTEWWPLSAIQCFKIIEPRLTESTKHRIVAQFKQDGRWMNVYEANLKVEAEEWIEAQFK